MKRVFKITMFLIIILILINTFVFYFLKPEHPSSFISNINNSTTIFKEKQIIPNCNDNDECTKDSYNPNEKICVYEEIGGCREVIEIRKLTTDPRYYDYYEIEDDTIYAKGDDLINASLTGVFGETGTKTHVIQVFYIFDFKENINNKDRKNIEFSFKCEDQDGIKIKARDDLDEMGWSVIYKEEDIYIAIDEATLDCYDSGCAEFFEIKDLVGISQGLKGGQGRFFLNLLINPKYNNIKLECEGEIKVDNPQEKVEFDFDIIYEN